MAFSTKNTTTESLKIHVLTEDIYEEINKSGSINENELYLVEGSIEEEEETGPIPLIAGGTGVSVSSVTELRSVLQVAASDHTSYDKSCGTGNSLKFGHVKLSDDYNLDSDVNEGIAATPAALKQLHDNIKELIDSKADINSSGTISTNLIGYAEIAEWSDGNKAGEDRIGYFVTSDTSKASANIIKATSSSAIRGVTVEKPGFSANVGDYKFNNDGELLLKYNYVLNSGIVTVRDNGKCVVGKTCMSSDSGIAIPSTNEMGYDVISRIDEGHIIIYIEPQGNSMVKLRNDMENKQDLLTWVTMDDIDCMINGTYNPETVGGAISGTDGMVLFLVRNDE